MNWPRVLRARWRMARNSVLGRGRKRAGPRSQRPLIGTLLAVVLGTFVCFALAGLFERLAGDGVSARETGAVLAIVLSAALMGMLVFDLGEVVSILVVDSDLELLRRAPVTPAALFLLKLADALPRTSLLLLVLALPAAIAYHLFYPIPLWGWLILPLLLLSLWAIPLGIGAAAAIGLLHRVPPRRAREALGLLSTVTLFVLWLANSFLLPRLAGSEGDPIARMRASLEGASWVVRLSPGTWAAEALTAAADGAPAAALAATAALLLGAFAALALAAGLAARYLEATQSAIAAGGSPRSARSRRAAAARRAAALVPGGASATVPSAPRSFLRAVLARDGKLFVRDWAVLGDVFTTAILWTLLPLLGAPLYHAPSHDLVRAMLLGLTVGLGYEVGARAIPLERNGMVWIRLGPHPAWHWVTAKFAGAALLSMPLMAIAAWSMALTLGIGARHMLEILCMTIPALALALSLGLWTGAVFGRSSWTNPRAMLTVSGRATATLILLLQAAGWLGIAALAEVRGEWLPPAILLWAPALIAVALGWVPLRATAARLARRESWG